VWLGIILYVNESWVILTAGFGAQNFEDAAQRVQSEAEKFGVSRRVIAVLERDLASACPSTSTKYKEYFTESHHGFGYFAWKSELVNTAFQGKWGPCDGVIWIDAGCEVNVNFVSSRTLRKLMKLALVNGAAAFTLNTTDEEYSKSKLFSLPEFEQVDPKTPQFQATWFILGGETGRLIAQKWFDISMLDIAYLDFSNAGASESAIFIEHRFDQSIFSLVLKSFGIDAIKNFTPVDGHSVKSQIRGFSHPVWTSRNRYGQSIKRILK
jgi:hypothetical protein